MTNGVGGNNFDPESKLTIEQFEVMLLRHYKQLESWGGNTAVSTRANAAELLYEYVTRYE